MIIEFLKKRKVPALLISVSTGLISILWQYENDVYSLSTTLYPPIIEKTQLLLILTITLFVLLVAASIQFLIMIFRSKKFTKCPKCESLAFKPVGLLQPRAGSLAEKVGKMHTTFLCETCGYNSVKY